MQPAGYGLSDTTTGPVDPAGAALIPAAVIGSTLARSISQQTVEFWKFRLIFAEPVGWFDGANLLRSKLPPAMQQNVRTVRREWAKGK